MVSESDLENLSVIELMAMASKNGNRRNACLSALYVIKVLNGEVASVRKIREVLKQGRMKGCASWNISDVLAKAGPLVHRDLTHSGSWQLTNSGRQYIEESMGLELDSIESTHSRKSLEHAIANITDQLAKDYMEEAYRCFQAGCHRATIVFLWSGTIRELQERSVSQNTSVLNSSLIRHESKAPTVRTMEDFAKIKERVQLLAFREMALIDKAEWKTLQDCLDLRNDCGHPTKLKPGQNRVASFVESICTIVFT